MKIVSLLSVAILFIASSVFAYDHTKIRWLPSEGTSIVPVHVPAGLSDVRVETNGDKVISCTFYKFDKSVNATDPSTLKTVVFEAKNTNVCLGKANFIVPELLFIKVENKNKEELLFRVWVHDSLPLKKSSK